MQCFAGGTQEPIHVQLSESLLSFLTKLIDILTKKRLKFFEAKDKTSAKRFGIT